MDSPAWFSDTVQGLSQELADADAPYLGAHVMSEFIFCPRAGIISVDQREDDTGCEGDDVPMLGGLPMHDVDSIRAALDRIRQELKLPITWSAGLAVMLLLGLLTIGWVVLPFFVPPFYFTGCVLRDKRRKYVTLRSRLREAETAAVQEPDWSLRQPQPIKWWCLIRAGFASQKPTAPIVDKDLHLAGKPFRILQRGAFHIPVMHLTVKENEDDLRRQGRLRPPQRARLTAYAYLLHHVQRTQSDWAIVLFKGSDQGVAIPIDELMLAMFAECLKNARAFLKEYASNPEYAPRPARETTPCVNCLFGKPTSSSDSSTFRGVPVTSFFTRSVDGRLYHCTCGDRFRWVPPHADAKRLGLLPR